jgi:hypothetical protein
VGANLEQPRALAEEARALHGLHKIGDHGQRIDLQKQGKQKRNKENSALKRKKKIGWLPTNFLNTRKFGIGGINGQ